VPSRALLSTSFHVGFFLDLFFDPEYGGDKFFPKRQLNFSGLYAIMFQKIELFITTAVRISNPRYCYLIARLCGVFVVQLISSSFPDYAPTNIMRMEFDGCCGELSQDFHYFFF
jgi:hypothetical protein